MKQAMVFALAAGLTLSAALPASAFAQGNRNRERARVEARANGNGPAFCRSGEGHPVHGREWCRDRGYRVGTERDVRYERRDRDDRSERGVRLPDRIGEDGRNERDVRLPGRIGEDGRDGERNLRWRRANFGDVRFRFSGSLAGRELNRSQLESLIGSRAIAQITRHAHESGANGNIYGLWTDTEPLVLRVFAGRLPLAEFIDRNLDRRVDTVNLAYWN